MKRRKEIILVQTGSRGAGGRNPCWLFGFFKFPETLSTSFNDDLEYMNLHSYKYFGGISEFFSPHQVFNVK